MKNKKITSKIRSNEARQMLLKMMYYMLLDYHRQPKIGETLKSIAGHKLNAARLMVTKKRMPVFSKELLLWLRMELNLSRKAFTPSEDHRQLIDRAMQRSLEHCLCMVIIAAEYGK